MQKSVFNFFIALKLLAEFNLETEQEWSLTKVSECAEKYLHTNKLVFPTNMQMSVKFGETYILVNESKQTHPRCK